MSWVVGDMDDAGGRCRRGQWMMWRMRVGVVDAVDGWGHGGRGWASLTWVVDDVADAGGRRRRRGRLGTRRTQVGVIDVGGG